jgi:hypothetical protein
VLGGDLGRPGPLSRLNFLGANLSDFMTQLGMTPTGGRTGTITRLRRQINRLFDAAISVQYHGEETVDAGLNLTFASGKSLWWTGTDRNADQRSAAGLDSLAVGGVLSPCRRAPRAAEPRCSSGLTGLVVAA